MKKQYSSSWVIDMLEFKNIYKSFEKPVVDNLCFRLNTGERLAIVGESGAGKTTVFNIILGITQADAGELINDFEKISTVFQENRLIEEISALNNLKMVTDKPDEEMKEMLHELKVDNFYEPVKYLSGGMKRRVAIARALMYEADLYLLDEPIQGLDDEIRKTVIGKILEITEGKSLLLISHSKEDVHDFQISAQLIL